MPGNYTLRRTYVDGDILSASDYVADHQQHIDNQTPQGTDDYSASVTQMRTTTDSGDVNSESLPTSLGGELERIRFVLRDIKTKINGSTVSQWYSKSYSVVVPNSTITTAKLADGATHVQYIRATATNVIVTDTSEHTLVSQAISLSRTRVRIRFSFEGIDFRSTGSSDTWTFRLKRGSTTILTTTRATVSSVGQGLVTITDEFLDTTTTGSKTYSVTLQMSGTNGVTASNFIRLVLEEVA